MVRRGRRGPVRGRPPPSELGVGDPGRHVDSQTSFRPPPHLRVVVSVPRDGPCSKRVNELGRPPGSGLVPGTNRAGAGRRTVAHSRRSTLIGSAAPWWAGLRLLRRGRGARRPDARGSEEGNANGNEEGGRHRNRGLHRAEAAERGPRGGDPLEEVGPVPQRAAVGDGPRGLQRGRQRLGLLLARPVPLPGLPVGRGRPRRDLRRQAAPVLRPRPLERAGPHPQGARVRPHQQRGEPRRGRQGVLLLPRLDADPLVHEVPLQVPAARVPLPGPPRDEPGADAGGARVRAPRHGDLRRRPVLRRLPRVRQGGTGRHPDPRVGPQPRQGGGPAAAPSDAVVPEHLVVGRRGREAGPPRERRGDRGLPSRAGRVHALLRRRPGAAVHGERDERREALGPAEPDAVREGRVPPVRDLRGAGRGEPREDRDEGRGALRPRGAGGRLRGRPAPPGQGPGGARRSARRSRRRSGSGSSTPTSSTTGSRPARSARTSAGSTARPSRGCSGRSSTTTSTWTGG